MSMPPKRREPEVGRSRSRKSLARVVLPDPDSPTMPRVSPSATCTLTPSRALIDPRVTGKYFVRSMPCRITAASCGDRRSRPAGRRVPVFHRDRGRCHLLADGLALGTARRERAAGREPRQVRGLPADLDELLTLEPRAGQTAQQRASVGMTG